MYRLGKKSGHQVKAKWRRITTGMSGYQPYIPVIFVFIASFFFSRRDAEISGAFCFFLFLRIVIEVPPKHNPACLPNTITAHPMDL